VRERVNSGEALIASLVGLMALVVLLMPAPAARATAPSPLSCQTGSLTTFTHSTPAAIPTGPSVVTSTTVVSGAGSYLADVDLRTSIEHEYAADLDVTLESPAGTVVTITTDNGENFNKPFVNTLWDDDSDPGGQVPYSENEGMVTDRKFTTLQDNFAASPLTPEEPLAAFIGEDPNGSWKLTVSDDNAQDGGTINSWELSVASADAPPPFQRVFSAGGPGVEIPSGPGVVQSQIQFESTLAYVADVNLTAQLAHDYSKDLDVTLASPGGTVVTLTTDNGDEFDDVFKATLWDDDANPAGQVPYTTNPGLVTDHPYIDETPVPTLTPEEPLGAFIGEEPNGTWTLTISDDDSGIGGTLGGWTLDVRGASCSEIPDLPPKTGGGPPPAGEGSDKCAALKAAVAKAKRKLAKAKKAKKHRKAKVKSAKKRLSKAKRAAGGCP